jgi:hypothetical protein
VSTSPWAPPQRFRSLRLQRLSTRRHVHQHHLTTTTTLWGLLQPQHSTHLRLRGLQAT